MEEVANNLSATINQQPDAIHVRVRPLEAFDPETLDWANSAARVSELELADDGGRLFLLVR